MWRKRTRSIAPDQDCVARGAKFQSHIERRADGHSGMVRDEQGVIRWRYGNRESSPTDGDANPFNKPDFVIAEPSATNELIIRRSSFIPSVFEIIDAGRALGTIRMRSIFRNKYLIDIDNLSSLTFRMPLFSVRFFGVSTAGIEIWVAVGPSEMEWNILIKPGTEEWPLLAALAFIHTERWNYG